MLLIFAATNTIDAVFNEFRLLFVFEINGCILPLFEGIPIEDKLIINGLKINTTKIGTAVSYDAKLYVPIVIENKTINIQPWKCNIASFVFGGSRFLNYSSLVKILSNMSTIIRTSMIDMYVSLK